MNIDLDELLHLIEARGIEIVRTRDRVQWTRDERMRTEGEILDALKRICDVQYLPKGAKEIMHKARVEIDLVDGVPHVYIFHEQLPLADALAPLWPPQYDEGDVLIEVVESAPWTKGEG